MAEAYNQSNLRVHQKVSTKNWGPKQMSGIIPGLFGPLYLGRPGVVSIGLEEAKSHSAHNVNGMRTICPTKPILHEKGLPEKYDNY